MDIQTLHIFQDVCRQLSFAAVATQRDLNASSISRTISQLEQELGVRLFNRTTRRMTLTEAGAIYRQRVDEILDQLQEAKEEAQCQLAAPVGTLKLTASVSYGETIIMPLLPEFRRMYPNVALELLFTDTNVDLVAEGIDLAVRLGTLTHHDYIATKLFDTRYLVCASPEYLTSCPPLNNPADLGNHRCCVFMLPNYRKQWTFCSPAGTTMDVPIRTDLTISSALSLRTAALAGMGPTLLQHHLVTDDLAAGRLINLFPEYEVSAQAFNTAAWLLYPSRNYLPRKTRVMIDFLKSRLGNG